MSLGRLLFAVLLTGQLVFAGSKLRAQDEAEAAETAEEGGTSAEMEPVMIDLTDRDAPSDEEWEAIHEDPDDHRGVFGLADFRSPTITFCDTRYLTPNAAEGTLASYGKVGSDKRFDRFGHIRGVEFSVDQNSWKQHHVVNAAALLKLAGSRFEEFAGIGFDAAVESRRQIEVTFVGTQVPKDEAIRKLNSDIEALEYLDTVRKKRNKYDDKSFKLLAGKAPPAPKVVLANVVMLNGNFSKALDASVDGKLHNRVVGPIVELQVHKKDGQTMTLLSPVVRCYRTYSVEFKPKPDGGLYRIAMKDAEGREHMVPQVFDLNPDM